MDKLWKKAVQLKEELGLGRLILVFLAGVCLLVFSLPSGLLTGSHQTKETTQKKDGQALYSVAQQAMDEYGARQEKQLEGILKCVEGVGNVDVMITLASSEEKRALQDESIQDENRQQYETVYVETEEDKSPYIVKVLSPQVEGVVVVAQGAGSGRIDTEIIEAVEALFPVESHKIRVMRMKE